MLNLSFNTWVKIYIIGYCEYEFKESLNQEALLSLFFIDLWSFSFQGLFYEEKGSEHENDCDHSDNDNGGNLKRLCHIDWIRAN